MSSAADGVPFQLFIFDGPTDSLDFEVVGSIPAVAHSFFANLLKSLELFGANNPMKNVFEN